MHFSYLRDAINPLYIHTMSSLSILAGIFLILVVYIWYVLHINDNYHRIVKTLFITYALLWLSYRETSARHRCNIEFLVS